MKIIYDGGHLYLILSQVEATPNFPYSNFYNVITKSGIRSKKSGYLRDVEDELRFRRADLKKLEQKLEDFKKVIEHCGYDKEIKW